MRRAVCFRSLVKSYSKDVSGADTHPRGQEFSHEPPPLIKTCPFKLLQLHDWQIHGVRGDRSILPPALFYHGDVLGPRPLLILDHSFPSSSISNHHANQTSNSNNNSRDSGSGAYTGAPSQMPLDTFQRAAGKYASMISHLRWAYGAVYIPLVVNPDDGDVLERSCREVTAVMDALDLRWSNFLTHSYGTLVAGRLATSRAYPHRIGSFFSLDTPLITDRMFRNAKHRAELSKAAEDVNIPAEMVSFVREELLGALEEVLPCPASEADGELYEKYLFNPDAIYDKGGLIRREERYIHLRQLSNIYHPWQLVVPAGQPLSDLPLHKEFFRLRRPAVIKSARSHEELFSDSSAVELAGVLAGWMNRFEPDWMIRRRYEQAAKEMSALVVDATASKTTISPGAGGKRKKEKKSKT
ncbi:unnamed protein product [Phytomonas sp. Hart1]|nr:unnamed protein product [Phytomonas sp. Hart1]|eukprot:CCW69723.1 unnamed protein product [Phytomonas sp. isolate Hart1]